jgi:hypothetical protein
MKSIAKVKQQKRRRNANYQVEHFSGIGIMSQVKNSNKLESQKEKRSNRKHSVRLKSRKANM